LDLSTGIAGAYCTKLLADAGATVVKAEPATGDPLRRLRANGAPVPAGEDGARFRYLHPSKRSLAVDPGSPGDRASMAQLLARAEVVVWSPDGVGAQNGLEPATIRAAAPEAIVLAVTPFGLDGPWAGRAATEFTLQAWSGSLGQRGRPDRPPVSVGGHTGEWASGAFGAAAVLASLLGRPRRPGGELLDLSVLEALVATHTNQSVTWRSIARQPQRLTRSLLFPGIERTRDGWVGLMLVTGQQWLDFCVMVGRHDWAQDPSLMQWDLRMTRRAELAPAIATWMESRTTEEIIELATLLRIPAAPVANGQTLLELDHLAERSCFATHPGGGFVQPSHPYQLSGSLTLHPFAPAPRLGSLNGQSLPEPSSPPVEQGRPLFGGGDGAGLPLAGLRVVELTAYWAGPLPGHFVAALGADVIHVESPRRLDGFRYQSARSLEDDLWWEYSGTFQGINANKRGLALDLTTGRGVDAALRLIARADVVIENYSPRVTETWGLTYERMRDVRDDLIFVRMPAYGLTGPWRERGGYAQTLECASGMAWRTGDPGDTPVAPAGPCDPIGGAHALVAMLLALEHRACTGSGVAVEAPMISAALNVTAEQPLEYSAYGVLLNRQGNRSATAVAQNLYRSADMDGEGIRDRWVAIAVETEEQWRALQTVVGVGEFAAPPNRDAEAIDAWLARWCDSRSGSEIIESLWPAGIPVALVTMPHEQDQLDQIGWRGYFETVDHPVTGPTVYGSLPVRFSELKQPTIRRPAPLLGEHNREILTEAGFTPAEIAALEADGILGRRPKV
jgi:crotonobetainyl-CoA:carnitine CoA-transferase CaiB-like acyl-CoA transferase